MDEAYALPPAGPQSLSHLFKALLTNPIAIWTPDYFVAPSVYKATLLGKRLIIADPQLVQHVLVDNAANYRRDQLQGRIVDRMIGAGVFGAEGEEWRRQRKLLAPFFGPRAVAARAPHVEAAARQAGDDFSTRAGEEIDIYAEMMALVLDAIIRAYLPGGLPGETPRQASRNIRDFAEGFGRIRLGDLLGLPGWVPGLADIKGRATRARVNARARTAWRADAAARATNVNYTSVITALTGGSAEPEGPWARRMVADNISTLLGAGTDSTAATLAWIFCLLARHPAARAKVEAEAEALAETESAAIIDHGLAPWTTAVAEEAMRLFPPTPVLGRQALQNDAVAGLQIAAGTNILIPLWVLHRHRTLWREPDHFQPERFLPENRGAITPLSYLPFGAGPRICIGARFAMLEILVVMLRLCRTLRFEAVNEDTPTPQQMITLQPRGLRLRLTLRAKS
jgi:cytochrome P450